MAGMSSVVIGKIAEEFFGIFAETAKEKLNSKKLQKYIEEIGTFIAGFEGDTQSEITEKLQQIFSKENMHQMYEMIECVPGYNLRNEIRKKLANLCDQYEVEPKKADALIGQFIKMLQQVLSQADPYKAMEMFLQDKSDESYKHDDQNTQRICDNSNKNTDRIINFLQGNQDSTEDIKSKSAQPEEQKLLDQIKWDLKHLKVEGLFGSEEQQKKQIRDSISQWEKERKAYPGWFVLPYEYRDQLRMCSRGEELLQNEELLPLKVRFDFAYELVWRYETGMLLYYYTMRNNIEKIWEQVHQQELLKSRDDRLKWLQMGLALLREYREDLQPEKWHDVVDTMTEAAKEFLDIKERLLVEQIEMSLVQCNLVEAVATAQCATSDIRKTSYALRLKLCSIKALCHLPQEAKADIGKLQLDLEKKIKKGKDLVYLKSVLACVYHLHVYILQAMHAYEPVVPDIQIEYRKKRDQLCSYYSYEDERRHCNRALLEWIDKKEKTPLFDLYRETTTIVGSSTSCEGAYIFYRILNKTALPTHLGCVTLLGKQEHLVIEALLEISSPLGWTMLLRSGEKKCAEQCLTRKMMINMEPEQRNQLFDLTYRAIDTNISGIADFNNRPRREKNMYAYIATTAVVILTRLASFATRRQQVKLIALVIKLINEDVIHEFRALDIFICAVMAQASEVSKAEMLNQLLECSAKTRSSIGNDRQMDPFDVFSFKEQTLPMFSGKKVFPELIDDLFKLIPKTKTERNVAFARLGQLYQWGKLSQLQCEKFGEQLWQYINPETHLPDMPDYYVFVFELWPHPEHICVADCMRLYFMDQNRLEKIKSNFGARNNSDVPYLDQLVRVNQNKKFLWNPEDMSVFVNFMCELWNIGRTESDQGKIIYDFEINNFGRIFRAWSYTLASFAEEEISLLSKSLLQRLKCCTEEMMAHGLAVYEAKWRLMDVEKEEEFSGEIIDAMYDTELSRVTSATRAMNLYILNKENAEMRAMCIEEVIKLVRARKNPGLDQFLVVIYNVLYEKKEKLSSKILSLLDKALMAIEKQTNYMEHKMTEVELKRNIEIRSRCAAMAYQLYQYEETFHADRSHSKGVMMWKDICCGDGQSREFTEVRNHWVLVD